MDFPKTRRGRRAFFFGLYACEGAPIGLLWWALPAELRSRGVAVDTITGLTALLVLPWTLKFLWAPIVDRIAARRRTLSTVIATAQLGMILTLLPLMTVDVASSFSMLPPLLVAHAVCAATQDVAIDALAIRSVPAAELGSLNGWMQAGMLLGRSVFGGGALIVAARVGFPTLIAAIAVWLVLFGSLALLFRAPGGEREARGGILADLRRGLATATTWVGLGIALTAGAGFEAVGAVAGPFLIDGGYTREEVGTWLFLPAVVAMTAGSLAGGALADRDGARRATALSGVVTALAVATLAQTAGTPLPALLAVYLGLGTLTATSYALFMGLTEPRIAATQFSAFMGATNGCEAWSGFAAGRIAKSAGYPTAFALLAAASLVALPLLRLVRPRRTPQR